MSEGTPEPADDALRRARIEAGIRAVREGHGANCSSIGSVVDTIFATAVIGGAVFAAVVAALGREKVRVAGAAPAGGDAPSAPVSRVSPESAADARERKP
jgi:hypothetical protein